MIDIPRDPVESGVSPRRSGSGFDWWDPGWTALDAGWIGTAIVLSGGTLDNTTGGPYAVNGTLEAVTYQVGFLGLNGAVVNAISNATDPSDGLWGPPTAVAPHLQPSGFLGAFWNAVTSFVTNPLGTVLSAIYTVWNAATAALTYLNHLAHEAVAIGAEVLARAASTLVSIGKAILSALSQLLNYLIQLVEALFRPITSAISSLSSAYSKGLWSGFTGLWAEYNNSPGSVSQSQAAQFVVNLFGGPFYIALAIGVVSAIALTIVSTLSLGAAFLVGILIGLVISLAVDATTTYGLGLAPPDFISGGTVSSAWSVYNSSSSGVAGPAILGDGSSGLSTSSVSANPYFGILLDILDKAVAGFGVYQALPQAIDLVEAVGMGVAEYTFVTLTPIVASSTGILSLVLDGVSHLIGTATAEGVLLSTIGFMIGVVGAIYSLVVLVKYWAALRNADQLNTALIGSGLDVFGTLLGLTDLIG